MRKIKFRQFVTGRFHYWGFLEKDCFTGPINPKDPSQQFTGLFSKDGKETYEGDIIKIGQSISFISFFNGAFRNAFPPIDNPIYEEGDIENNAEYSEVIGNIYEHSHLLEK